MPEYLAPGVYVEETSYRAKSIEGVSTSTCGFVGPTRKGPIEGIPELITNFGEFERRFGGYADLSFSEGSSACNYVAHAVRGFFENGGGRLYVARTYVPRTDSDGNPIDGCASYTTKGQFSFKSRYPGSGYNGLIKIYQKAFKIVGKTALEKAKVGSLIRVSEEEEDDSKEIVVATPAQLTGTKPNFAINPQDNELKLNVNSTDDDKTITFEAEAAKLESTEFDPDANITIPDNTVLTIRINNGGESEIVVPAVADKKIAEIVELINNDEANESFINEIELTLSDNKILIKTKRLGTGAALKINALEILNFAATKSAKGNGNVANIENVTVEEINQIVSSATNNTVKAFIAPTTGVLCLETSKAGEAASLQARASDVQTLLGLPTEKATGGKGYRFKYYKKNGNQWQDSNGVNFEVKEDEKKLVQLLTINLEAVDADGSRISYEDIGFDEMHPRYIGKVLEKHPSSKMEQLETPYYFIKERASLTTFQLRRQMFGVSDSKLFLLSGGNDGSVPTVISDNDNAVTYSEALEKLASIDDISLVAAPGYSSFTETNSRDIQNALITHAELCKYRIAILDSRKKSTLQNVRSTRSRIDSTYAAFYYPWVTIINPLWTPGNNQVAREINVPPCGFIAGIYARTDISRGVWKSPANEIVRGALRFEQNINRGQQEVLNSEGINCLRFFSGRGYRVWGARTVSSETEWKYINVRRYFIYLEHSIDRSTQWAVFEPNGPRLWANVTDTVNSFLYNEWRNGALLGKTPEAAFFVRCDRSTMTQADLDNGRMICEIGVAAIKPAEFVIFRIGQKTADAK